MSASFTASWTRFADVTWQQWVLAVFFVAVFLQGLNDHNPKSFAENAALFTIAVMLGLVVSI